MKQLTIEPDGWTCTLKDCPPGFFLSGEQLCFKSEYYTNDKCDAYNSAGEYFCGPPDVQRGDAKRNDIIVQPVTFIWSDIDA